MDAAEVKVLAELVKQTYAPDRLETGVREPTIVESADGFRAVALPRDQMFEPYRSFHLLDAAALDTTLVISFRWDDGHDDGTIFVMPLDGRDVTLDLADECAVTTFMSHHLEWTLGGPRESWEAARSTPISRRLTVVRPWGAGE
ncbi:hypothetical protein ACU61A_36120 [Pseudonocardia sichuanensis]